MIDTHCHLSSNPLFKHVEAVIARAQDAGVHHMISVSTSIPNARQAIELARQFPCVDATVGVHPHEAAHCTDRPAVIEPIAELSHDPATVAIGEIGLDTHYPDPPLPDQQRLFEWQLQAAADTDLPIIIHNRQATDHVLAMIRAWGIPADRFVFHCFTGSPDELSPILDFGAMVSFTGIVTFKNAAQLAQSAVTVPLDRLMIETDSPYLTPHPHRKIHPNEPAYLPFISDFLANQRQIDPSEFIQLVDANAKRFFNLHTTDDS